MATNVPTNYSIFNAIANKNISVVVVIDGVPDLLSSTPIFKKFLYGDPGNYGDPGLVYGGLIEIDGVRDILSLEGSSLNISQKIEPEQGRGSVSILTLAFIDKDQYMSRLVGGQVVPELMGKSVEVFLGYKEISWPQDFIRIFRGVISGFTSMAGLVTLQLSDPGIRKRQMIFYSAKTTLSASVNNSQGTIPVNSTADFHDQIHDIHGNADPAIKTYIKVENEFMEYGFAGILGASNIVTTRGSRGTTAVSHPSGATVEAWIQIQDHAVDMALKIMLSGWNGFWLTGVPVLSIVNSTDPMVGNIPGAIILPDNVDAVKNYGLAVGDLVHITGGSNNNLDGIILEFQSLFEQPNRVIVTQQTFTVEYPTTATIAFRSQYDSYPTSCGLKLTNQDVDVAAHVDLKQSFLSSATNRLRFLINQTTKGKDFIDVEIWLPVSAYSLTRQGRLGVGFTHPPLPTETLRFLTKDNVINPQQITPTRATNNRKFFNQIEYVYDFDDAGDSQSTLKDLDSDSLNTIGILSVLPITSKGLRTDLSGAQAIENRAQRLLSRYKNGAVQIICQVTWELANLIEAGDVVAIDDPNPGTLQITNFSTGDRFLGTQLFEVIDRTLDIKTGNARLTLISGIGAEVTDRYGTVAPSSIVGSGSTTTSIIITNSYGHVGDEKTKWTDYIGLKVTVHKPDYSSSTSPTFQGFDSTDPNKMLVSTMGFTPASGDIVEIVDYPTTTDANENRTYKLIHAYFDNNVVVTAGISTSSFKVSSASASRFSTNQLIRVHTSGTSWALDSGDVKISSVTTVGPDTTITTTTSLGFTPSAGFVVEFPYFADGGSSYRFI